MRLLFAGAATLMIALAVAPAHAQVDIEGNWAARQHEDAPERGGGPEIGRIPRFADQRRCAETWRRWNASIWTVPEHQCIPHPADYGPNFSPVRIWKDVDPVTQEVVAYHTKMAWMNPIRTIWMDGRPHPPENAPHTWKGFRPASGKATC